MGSVTLYLVQFAQMGSAYMELVEGVREPSVGLLNNGEEAEKGNELTRETYPLLQALDGIPCFSFGIHT